MSLAIACRTSFLALLVVPWTALAQPRFDDEFDTERFAPERGRRAPLGLVVRQAPGGVVVQYVQRGSVAAGDMDVFDVIRSVDGRDVVDEGDFARLVDSARRRIRMVVWKSALKRDVVVELDASGGGRPPGEPPSESMLGILYRFEERTGVTITDVLPGSPAARAGLTAGLNIVEIDGELMRSSALLEEAIAKGGLLRLRLYDRGLQRWQVVNVKVAPPNGRPGSGGAGDVGSTLGVTLNNYDQQSGVVIAQIAPRSPAAQARLQTGDLIVAINREPIRRLEDLRGIELAGDPTVQLTIRARGPGNSFGPPLNRIIILDPNTFREP